MSVVLNAKGTSVPYFTIGKTGVTLYQGLADPQLTYTIKNGDYWLDSSTNNLWVWYAATLSWGAPRLDNLAIINTSIIPPAGQNLVLDTLKWPQTDGTSGQVLTTDGSENLSFSTVTSIGLSGNTVNTNTENTSITLGSGANSSIYGGKVFANGNFSSSGDAQHGVYVLRNITTDATPTELFLDGTAGTQRLVLPNNSVFTFSVLVAAKSTSIPSTGAGYKFDGVAVKDSSNNSISFIGIPSKTVLGETVVPWDVNISTDTTNGAIIIKSTGTSSATIRWVATVLTSEVTN